MLVYKVVWKETERDRDGCKVGERYESLCGSIIEGAALEYEVGCTTRPRIPGSGIFCFDTFEAADRWRKVNCVLTQTRILECEVQSFKTAPFDHVPMPGRVWEVWEAIMKKEPIAKYLTYLDLPIGTVLCDEVKVVRVVS